MTQVIHRPVWESMVRALLAVSDSSWAGAYGEHMALPLVILTLQIKPSPFSRRHLHAPIRVSATGEHPRHPGSAWKWEVPFPVDSLLSSDVMDEEGSSFFP